jgi:transcriptional antiterminator Rof (Rho-off)
MKFDSRNRMSEEYLFLDFTDASWEITFDRIYALIFVSYK